jgi:hypothetical protein
LSISTQDEEDLKAMGRKEVVCNMPGTPIMFGLDFLQVNNLSQRDLDISVTFWVPILLDGMAVWDVAVRAPAQVPAQLSSLASIPQCHPPHQRIGTLVCLRSFLSLPRVSPVWQRGSLPSVLIS